MSTKLSFPVARRLVISRGVIISFLLAITIIRGSINKSDLEASEINSRRDKIMELVPKWSEFISARNCELIFQHGRHLVLRTHFSKRFYTLFYSVRGERYWFASDPIAHSNFNFGIEREKKTFKRLFQFREEGVQQLWILLPCVVFVHKNVILSGCLRNWKRRWNIELERSTFSQLDQKQSRNFLHGGNEKVDGTLGKMLLGWVVLCCFWFGFAGIVFVIIEWRWKWRTGNESCADISGLYACY